MPKIQLIVCIVGKLYLRELSEVKQAGMLAQLLLYISCGRQRNETDCLQMFQQRQINSLFPIYLRLQVINQGQRISLNPYELAQRHEKRHVFIINRRASLFIDYHLERIMGELLIRQTIGPEEIRQVPG